MLPSFRQVASVIVFATFGATVAFSERLCEQSEQYCLGSAARDVLRRQSVVKDYFRTQKDLNSNAIDSRFSKNRDSRTRELDGRKFDIRTNRLYRVYKDRSLSTERGLSRERIRSNAADNEQTKTRLRERSERRMNQSDRRFIQHSERQEKRKELSNQRPGSRSTLKTENGRNTDLQQSFKRANERIASTIDFGRGNRERSVLKENSQRTHDLFGSFNTRREVRRTFASRRQVDERRQHRDGNEKQENSQKPDVENRRGSERRELDRDSSDFKSSIKRSINSNERFDINRNFVDARIRRYTLENNNRRPTRDLREVQITRQREQKLENLKILNTERDGQSLDKFNERRQTRNIIGSHILQSERTNGRINELDEYRLETLRLEHENERKVHDKFVYSRLTAERKASTERRSNDRNARLRREEKQKTHGTSAENRQSERNIRLERENERKEHKVRDERRDFRNSEIQRQSDRSIARRGENKRSLQETRAERRNDRNIRFKYEDERTIRDPSHESRNMRLEGKSERREYENRAERLNSKNTHLEDESEQREQTSRTERRGFRNTQLEREDERNTRYERVESERIMRLGRENERREQATRAKRRDSSNTRLKRGGERTMGGTRDERVMRRERESQRGILEIKIHNVSNMQLERETDRRIHASIVKKHESRMLERKDKRKMRYAGEERKQYRRIVPLNPNVLTDSHRHRSFIARVERGGDIIPSPNRETTQHDSLKKWENLNIQMLRAFLIGMIVLKVVTQQNTFTKKIHFMADRYKNIVSVGARKFF